MDMIAVPRRRLGERSMRLRLGRRRRGLPLLLLHVLVLSLTLLLLLPLLLLVPSLDHDQFCLDDRRGLGSMQDVYTSLDGATAYSKEVLGIVNRQV